MLQSTASRVPRRVPRPLLSSNEPIRPASTAVQAKPKPGAALPRFSLPLPTYRDKGARTVYGRFSDLVPSVAQAMAALRAIEQKYGRVADFKFHRDFEIPSNLQLHFLVRFHNAESVKLLPDEGETIHIESPDVNIYREGGISLKELIPQVLPKGRDENFQSLLLSEFSQRELKSIKPISFKLQHTHMVLSSRSQTIVRGRSTALDVSRSFLKWGGFYNLPKMEPRLIEDLELFSDNTAATDHIRMRRVLQKHSAVLGVRNPCEITRRENVTATAPIKWESIPGLEDASVAAEDPSETIQTEVSASRHTRLRGRLSDADTIQKEVSTVQQAIQHKAQQDIDSAFRLSQRSATTPRPTPIETPKGSVLPEINEIPIDRDANVVSKKQPVARDSKVNRTNAQEKQATITQSVVQVAVGRGSAERNSQAKLAELKQRAVELEAANARLKAAEIEAAARLKAAKIAADKAKLDAQLKAAERAANRLAGKRGVTQSTKVEEEMVALKEVDFRPSFKMRPEVKAKMEEQLEGEMEEETEKEREEKSTESLASRITSFFKLGSR